MTAILTGLKAIGFRGAIALALGVALFVVMMRADAISNDRDEMRNALATCNAEHAVTKQSVTTLTNEMQRMVNEGLIREDELVKALEAQEEKTRDLKEEAKLIRSLGVGADCRTPDAILRSRNL